MGLEKPLKKKVGSVIGHVKSWGRGKADVSEEPAPGLGDVQASSGPGKNQAHGMGRGMRPRQQEA